MNNPICCICGQICENQWGNNPYPLVKEENARCCNVCNDLVIAERMRLLIENNNKNKETKQDDVD